MRAPQSSLARPSAPPPADRAAPRRPALLPAACGALVGALCLWALLVQRQHPGAACRRADALRTAGGRVRHAPPPAPNRPAPPGPGGAYALRSADGRVGAPRPAGAGAAEPMRPRLAVFGPEQTGSFGADGPAAAAAAESAAGPGPAAAAAATAARARAAARKASRKAAAAARLPQHRERAGGAGDATPKVALLFLTTGALPHEPTWRAFFEAAGRLSFADVPPRAPPPPALADTLRGAPPHPPLAPWPEEAYPEFKRQHALGPWAPGKLKRGAALLPVALAAAAAASAAHAGSAAAAELGKDGAAAGARGVARHLEAALRRRAPSNMTAAEARAARVAASRNERLRSSWPAPDGTRAAGGASSGSAGGLVPGVQAWEAAAVQREVRRLVRESPGAAAAAAAAAGGEGGPLAAPAGGGPPRAGGRPPAAARRRRLAGRRRRRARYTGSGGLHPLITSQRLFSVYVHPPPGKYLPAGSIFSGLELPEALRANTTSSYLQYALAGAAIELLRAAAADRSNVKFVLVSETSMPLYPPEVIYAQLMAEEQSRVHACIQPWRRMNYHRWHPGMRTGHFTEAQWRKSMAWFALTRAHADVVLADGHVTELFRRWCAVEGRDGRMCVSDEHVIPSLLASYGLDFETDCRGVAHFVDWSVSRNSHPRTFKSGEVWAAVAAARGRSAACGAAGAVESARKLFRLEPAGGGNGGGGMPDAAAPPGDDGGGLAGGGRPAPREWAAGGGYLPLGYECPLFARKFEAAAAAEVAAAALSCAGVGLGEWCAAARGA